MSEAKHHTPDSVERGERRRGRVPCWLSDFGQVLKSAAAGPKSRGGTRESELHSDHNIKSWLLG